MKLFVDLDGVLADFDKGHENAFGYKPTEEHRPDWKLIEEFPHFYKSLPLMKDAMLLWVYVWFKNPIILTGIPETVKTAALDKKEWVAHYLGNNVPVICTLTENKWTYAELGDILIDDRPKNKDLWENAGGIWITHTNVKNTIKQLKDLGI